MIPPGELERMQAVRQHFEHGQLSQRKLSVTEEETHQHDEPKPRLVSNVKFTDNAKLIDKQIDSLFAPFIEELSTNWPFEIPLGNTSAIENLKHRLSSILHYALNEELKKYRKANNIKTRDLSTAIDAQDCFLEFLKQFKGEQPTILDALIHNNPKIKELCDRTTEAYIESLKILNNRIKLDLDQRIIHRFFEASGKLAHVENATLKEISSSNSDPHHNGQQVLILTFDVDGVERKMVYKPSPIEIDSKITGNSHQLSQVLGSEQPESFFELVNDKEPGPKYQLPTYLIVPRYDAGKSKIDGGYGYAEYLSHKPWKEIDFDKEAKEFFGKYAPSDRERHFEAFREYLKEKFETETLGEAKLDLDECDYVTDKQSDVERYSYLCGAYTAAMCTLGISDMHIENAIISNKIPYIIDLESSLNIPIPDVEGTLAFDPQIGAFLNTSQAPVSWTCFLDIDGEFSSKSEQKIEKNRYYTYNPGRLFLVGSEDASSKEKDLPQECEHDYPHLEQGFTDIVNIICANKAEFSGFAESLDDVPVRVVVIETRDLYGDRENFIFTYLNSMEEAFLTGVAQDQLKLLKAFVKNPDRASRFMAFSSGYFKEQFTCMSIPTYYAISNQQSLHDCHGEVMFKIEDIEQLGLEKGDAARLQQFIVAKCVKDNQICYYLICSPKDAVVERIKTMRAEDMLAQFMAADYVQTFNKDKKSTEKLKDEKARDCCCGLGKWFSS